jgi:hypothetical protein
LAFQYFLSEKSGTVTILLTAVRLIVARFIIINASLFPADPRDLTLQKVVRSRAANAHDDIDQNREQLILTESRLIN